MKKVLMAVCVLGVWMSAVQVSAQEWYEKIKLSGDFRNRFEYISDDSVKDGSGDVIKRYRDRIRLRVGATADVAKDLKVTFRLATGESSDPISTNQSMTTGFSKKGVNLDLAFAEYKASESSSLFGLNAVIGKMNNPLYKPGGSDMIWDNDISPEGVFVSYTRDLGEKFKIKGLLGGFWIEERSKTADSGMLAVDLIGTFKATEKLSFDLGLSYYNYGNAQDNQPFYDATKGFGNSTNAAVAPATTISYVEDFDLMKIGFEAGYNFNFAPVKFFVDFVNNTGADGDLDTGFLVGFSVGKISGPKTWMFSYSYRNLEADASIGAFADSDISGGGTDIKGSRISAEYAIYKNWTVATTVFIGNKKIDSSSDKYTRVQVDLNFKF